MSSQLQILAGTIVDDASTGSVAWTNPDNAKVSDNVYATTGLINQYANVTETRISIVKADGTIGTTNKSTGATLIEDTDTYVSYGGSTDLWDETWDDTKINDIDFGVVFSVIGNATSHYLKATNFGFSIPSGATINGILVEIEQQQSYAPQGKKYASVDHIRITVYYTEAAAGPANLKSYNTNLKANIKSINTNLIANVKSYNTLT